LYTDSVGIVQNQEFLNVQHIPVPPGSPVGTNTTLPHDGLLGFDTVQLRPGDIFGNYTTWFQNLCAQGDVPECRFGLALGTNGIGTQVIGELDASMYKGKLHSYPLLGGFQWTVAANITHLGKVVDRNLSIIFDSGTANIVGPTEIVRELFLEVGIQPVEQHLPDCTAVLFGYYNCSSPPPIGFEFGDGMIWHIEKSAFAQANDGEDDCTAIITGLNGTADGLLEQWIVGQAFYQGKYLDHNAANKTLGLAMMK
jgi:cathepsin D